MAGDSAVDLPTLRQIQKDPIRWPGEFDKALVKAPKGIELRLLVWRIL